MNSAGTQYATEYQVSANLRHYVLPSVSSPTHHGVGIYWKDIGVADWDAKGYPTTVVKEPATTLLLVEEPCGNNLAGNIWPCISLGPSGTAGKGNGELYQIAPNDPYNQGAQLYKQHGKRFNYLFHDGHVELLGIEQTVGTGTVTTPRGMWTIASGD